MSERRFIQASICDDGYCDHCPACNRKAKWWDRGYQRAIDDIADWLADPLHHYADGNHASRLALAHRIRDRAHQTT